MDSTTATSSAKSTKRSSRSSKKRPTNASTRAGSSSHPLHFFPKTYSPDSFFHSTTIAPSAHPTTLEPCVSYSRKVTTVTNTYKSGKQTVDLRPSPLQLDEGTRDPNCSQSGISYPASEAPTDLSVQFKGIGPNEVTFTPSEFPRPFSARAAPADLRSDATMMSRLEGTECVGIKLSKLHQNPRSSWLYRAGGPWDAVKERNDMVGTATWYFAPQGNISWIEREEQQAAIRQQEEAERQASQRGSSVTNGGRRRHRRERKGASPELDDWTYLEEPGAVVAFDDWDEEF